MAGFRLDRLELWNWGTFHGDVQVLEPRCGWTLLIGDNGSGKSTAIDALRTLLVPPRIINYNDAAADTRRGASRDRSRRSYIRGAWSASSTIDSTAATTQYLRDAGRLSAIAGVFADPSRNVVVTAAQVLWMQDDQVREFFAITVARRGLAELIGGGTTSTEIRRSARTAGWDIHDTFAAYGERLRALLHIPGDKALEVFNRATGMKEVGDVDAFVRQFMMPAADTYSFIHDAVQPHYHALIDCWMAIERAERQIDLLRPIAENAATITRGENHVDAWNRLVRLVPPFFATAHLELLQESGADLAASAAVLAVTRSEVEDRLTRAREERDGVKAKLNASEVGARIESIDKEIGTSEKSLNAARQHRNAVEPAAVLLGMRTALDDATSFAAARPGFDRQLAEGMSAAEDAESRRASHKFDQEQSLQRLRETRDELESVMRHRVNIPRHYIAVRTKVAEAANVSPDHMPFAGELIEVLEAHAEWTGAIERLLRPFALSLLIPDRVQRRAAAFANATHLGIRLVIHPISETLLTPPSLSTDTVPGRLRYRVDHAFHLWVATEVVRRFRHRCCGTAAELEASEYGITREGMIREPRRYVKDDVHSIHDASTRILGWSTDAKIAALEKRISDLESEATRHGQAAQAARESATAARNRVGAAQSLLAVIQYADISPAQWSAEIVRLKSERATLERDSEEIAIIMKRLDDLDGQLRTDGECLSDFDGRLYHVKELIKDTRAAIEARGKELATFGAYDHADAELDFSTLAFPIPTISIDDVERQKSEVIGRLHGLITDEGRRIKSATGKLTSAMRAFIERFTEFTQTLQSEVAYAQDFVALLARVEGEELPGHRARFEEYLNENLVGDLQMLHHRLEEHHRAIESRIAEINAALGEIPYGEGTFVQLRLGARPTADVTEFRRHLRTCFEFGITPTREEQLQIFDRVRSLVERFKQEPELTQRVTDVRNWFAAGVQELSHDGREVNYYSASTGKSGGQKAKLAFTILASALAAQYGLSTGRPDAPNFRLVVIDEAFSRTDEANSTQAMALFAQLGFQLLIVGPFDAKAKLAVPFVQSIHLASNPGGDSSALSVLDREQVASVSLAAD